MRVGNWIVAFALLLGTAGCALRPTAPEEPERPPVSPTAVRPAITVTEMVTFNGEHYRLGFRDSEHDVPVYEYFLPHESPSEWTELIGFRVYPPRAGDNSPLGHAEGTAALFEQHFPGIEFVLYQDVSSDAAMLDLVVPAGPGRAHLEFNIFKFFRDSGSDRIISFHYSRKLSGTQTAADSRASTQALRQELLPAMAAFPLYRHEE